MITVQLCTLLLSQEPVTVELGVCLGKGPGGTMCDRRETFQYIPLEDGLRSFLANREVFDEVPYILG